MKALILAGGRGKRLGELSQNKNKCMTEVKGRPLIQYSLDLACKMNISEMVILVGYRAEDITSAFGTEYKGIPIKYAVQPEQKGLVNAIECAAPSLGGEDFILMLGDELMIQPRHQQMLDMYKKEGLFAVCGVINAPDKNLVKKTYCVVERENNIISRLIEKPENPLNNIMGTGNVILKNEILSYIPKTPINANRGEKELVDLIQCAIDDGKIVKSFYICDSYLNINNAEELKEAESSFYHP
ncbi:MAG: nucleotidyl transferase [Candidatus Staskawiczbacteria bacterium RIFOXYD2_FULL_37_9]|uniref:Nucleotidyl transferase n=1 Tax=Candidatus Staskawiczbacteria bacterium RIFOXYB1_FULL_37_44 TaxID=1802223 RepID=A0A1G2IXM6_9BACT|nr:MAG: nucleotidyl transferase [Candidatus Staskawiczbacteria bacterium RIFOXYB1_FULL_37_44]OGZ83374.1 MAG: nucleotidyl transferase [Candidatus Staskawiczbacteria bacterium RIFOXYC1_FULL_37_52]OGZ86923.1 MAG: nucleotidyl transferase [Candidatus Staskawiczbacteria bacterium RIFOXYC2_FULL_37_19]OGZ88777.1 MAG: nucleotidyl transferase [Candidatus Staskawiczbacteria bacterium RIFOXYD1_FULL_37_110]OGZ93779.1 MAG: nucleotidyl transferase [Candidatus Staskawiczbacteria bacterium RIFOXYD2_FULL_37_9]